MAITTIQCKSDSGELLFPQVNFNQIVSPTGLSFEETWTQLKDEVLQVIYPLGSIVILESSSDPNELFPNTTWERTAEGRILVGKGYLNNNTSSTLIENDNSVSTAYAVQITTSTLPSHTHKLYVRTELLIHERDSSYDGRDYGKSGSTYYSAYRGGGGYHSNVMPYICANIWTRIA